MAYLLASHKYSTMALQITSFRVLLLFTWTTTILDCEIGVGVTALTFDIGSLSRGEITVLKL